MSWCVVFTKHTQKDARKLAKSNLKPNVAELLSIIEKDPFQAPPSFEKLTGDFSGAYSRRINLTHRLVYQVFKEERTVKVLRMWTHYGES